MSTMLIDKIKHEEGEECPTSRKPVRLVQRLYVESPSRNAPIPRGEVFPGRYILAKKTVSGKIMEKALKLVKTEALCRHYILHGGKMAEEDINIGQLSVKMEALKQYRDGKEVRRQQKGSILESNKIYIRHRDAMEGRTIDLLRGRIKKRKPRRTWSTPFDELEHKNNRLLLGRSVLHPILGFMKFSQFSFVTGQAWMDYDEFDFSDFFTLVRLLTYLHKDKIDLIPRYVILRDYFEHKVDNPPGLEAAFEKVRQEILIQTKEDELKKQIIKEGMVAIENKRIMPMIKKERIVINEDAVLVSAEEGKYE